MFGCLYVVLHPIVIFAMQLGVFNWAFFTETPAFPTTFNGTVIVNSAIPGQVTEFPESTQADAGILEEDGSSISGPVVEFPVRIWAASRLLQEEEEEGEADDSGCCCCCEADDSCCEEAEGGEDELVQKIINIVGYLVLTLAVMVCYKSGVTDKRPKPFQPDPNYAIADGDFRFTTFDCFGDCNACLYGCCCWESRLGDNMETTGIMQYWPAGCTAIALYVAGQILAFIFLWLMETNFGSSPAPRFLRLLWDLIYFYIVNGVYALWLAGKVQTMRKALGDSKPEAKKMNDCICLCFCGCCEIIKHGRHIDAATGVKVDCPCKMGYSTRIGALVGAPVQAAPVVQATVIQAQPVQKES